MVLFLGFTAMRIYFKYFDGPIEPVQFVQPKLDLEVQPAANPVETVVKIDRAAKSELLRFLLTTGNPDAIQDFIRQLGAVDLSQCPSDIRVAHQKIVGHFRAFATEMKARGGLTDQILNSSDPNATKSVLAAVDQRRALLEASIHELNVAATKYGVPMPE